MTITVEPDAALETARLKAVADHEREVRETYAARLNAAGHYVMTLRGIGDKQRRELLALLYGHRDQT